MHLSLFIMQITPPSLSNQVNNKKDFFSQRPRLNLNLFQQPDAFIKHGKRISFGERNDENFNIWLEKIKGGVAKLLGSGWQGKFYNVGHKGYKVGMKVPKPLYPDRPGADIYGHHNVGEYYALKKIKEIDKSIATNPIDLAEKDGKYYLISEIIEGTHPSASDLTETHLKGIIDKSFKLDINGIVHTDIQSQNIILENESNERFIDYGAFNFLTNHGKYIDSNDVDFRQFMQGGWVENETNMDFKQKFISTFYNNDQKYDIKNYSDNPYLKIKSNISNFEFRTIYDYLMLKDQTKPLETFGNYLKLKANNYHSKMIEFLASLDVKDEYLKNQINNAIEHEKIFKEVFSNPSDKIVETELGKIQVKWLANDFASTLNTQPGRDKVKSTLRQFMQTTQEYRQQATGSEKKYFESVLSTFSNFIELQWLKDLPEMPLPDEDNILKVVLNKHAKI